MVNKVKQMPACLLLIVVGFYTWHCVESSMTIVNGPRNITRTEGTINVVIPCEAVSLTATPFWKINNSIYYFSDIPPPFVSTRDGRYIVIPTIDVYMNRTSFQCFFPISLLEVAKSSVGVLMVTKAGAPLTPRSNYLAQPHLVLDHQNLLITMNYLSLKWRIVNGDNCIYNLVVIDSCDSSTKVILNETMNNSLILRYDNGESADTGNFSNSNYINITSHTSEGNQCGFLERLQFATIITETKSVSLADPSYTSATPSCIDVPPLTGTQTLVLAIPFTPMDSSTPDILCPIFLHSGERCVDLLSCNRFSESVYANSITICRTADNVSSLEMCFHNVTEAINGTKIHFFYSDLLCSSDVTISAMHESSRTYIRSMQLIVDYQEKIPTTATLPESDTTRGTESPSLNTLSYLISGFILTFTAGLGVGIACSCFLCLCLQKKKSSNVQGDSVTFTENPAYDVIHL